MCVISVASEHIDKIVGLAQMEKSFRKTHSLEYICIALHSSLSGLQTKSLSVKAQDIVCSPDW